MPAKVGRWVFVHRRHLFVLWAAALTAGYSLSVVDGRSRDDQLRKVIAQVSGQTRENIKLSRDNRKLLLQVKRLTADGVQSHTALCAQRVSLRQQIKQSEVFLKTHPEGFAGISAQEIQVSIDRQKKVIEAYRSLRCH